VANAVYNKARNKFLKGEISWKSGGDNFRAYLVDTTEPNAYVFDADHEFLDSIHPDKLVSFVALVPDDPVGGVADAPDVTFLAVSGAVCEAIVIVKWVTEAADSPLVAYINSATGLPVTPNTGDILVAWDAGVNKIFKL
jgi:hypothetical protein